MNYEAPSLQESVVGNVNYQQTQAMLKYQERLKKEKEQNTVRIPTRLLQAVSKSRTDQGPGKTK